MGLEFGRAVARCTVAASKVQPTVSPLHVFAGYRGTSAYTASATSIDVTVQRRLTIMAVTASPPRAGEPTTITAKATPHGLKVTAAYGGSTAFRATSGTLTM